MPKKSAGILVFRRMHDTYEVLLVHPGGPFWAKKDMNSWSVPKGEFTDEEDALSAAKREFEEETGFSINGKFQELGKVRQPGGKIIFTWAIEGNFDPTLFKSNLFNLEWPPHSGKFTQYPEVDRAEWFTFAIAKQKILSGQIPILENLEKLLNT